MKSHKGLGWCCEHPLYLKRMSQFLARNPLSLNTQRHSTSTTQAKCELICSELAPNTRKSVLTIELNCEIHPNNYKKSPYTKRGRVQREGPLKNVLPLTERNENLTKGKKENYPIKVQFIHFGSKRHKVTLNEEKTLEKSPMKVLNTERQHNKVRPTLSSKSEKTGASIRKRVQVKKPTTLLTGWDIGDS